ncbi:MAG: SMC-Scp complex subunit ScpB [Actinomycetota bacterium]|nr:SMC-Scp complex subunit ScpB [Actinomycetota bacterium]
MTSPEELTTDEHVELADAETRGAAESDGPQTAPLVDLTLLQGAIEAILFVVEAPVRTASIAAALQIPEPAVAEAIERVRVGYDERGAGIELRYVAGGVRIYTRSSVSPQVEIFLQDGQRSRLTQAALETLAVIAYRQPVTRARVSAIRGVNVDGVIRTLLTRGLIVEAGSDPDTGGGLFRTTDLFLEKMSMGSLDELPSLAPLLPELDGLDSDEL